MVIANALKLARKWLRTAAVALVVACTTSVAIAEDSLELPRLGATGNSLMSAAQEQALGQAWLRSFRASVPLEEDPLLFEYVEDLLMRLASHSELEHKRLDLVVVANDTINAFAVPGGIVGVHTGLLLSAESEGQLASVLTHELAHLSQQHFARSVEAARQANTASITGLLAGIILAATAGGDAASAAIAASQAAAIDTQLRYSRAHEREADRLGMKTLNQAGYKPSEAAAMFREMQDASRLYGSNVPEFLRTHPITESRIADAENRARQIGDTGLSDSLDFQLMKARIFVLSHADARKAVDHFQRLFNKLAEHERASESAAAIRYGLALAQLRAGNWQQARKELEPLLVDMQGRIPYLLLDTEIDIEAGNTEFALRRLRDLYALTPTNYSIGMLLAKTANMLKQYDTAEKVLLQLSESRPSQADVWYALAETHGLAGNIVELHRARAEFFILRGNFNQAKYHLQYALKIAGDDFQHAARIKQRLRYVVSLQAQQKALG